MQLSDTQSLSLPIQVHLIREDQPNRIGTPFQANDLFITVHENNNAHADALAESAFFLGGGGDKKVALHFVVDDEQAVQLLLLDEQGNTATMADLAIPLPSRFPSASPRTWISPKSGGTSPS